MPKFAANLSFLYTDLPFLDRFEAAAKDGFKAVEFLFPYAFDARDIAARLKTNGLQQALFNLPPAGVDADSIDQAWQTGKRGIACLLGHEAEFTQGLDLALRYAEVLQCAQLHMMAGIVPASFTTAVAQQTYIKNALVAGQRAAAQGVNILIEPINTRDMPGYFLNHQAHAHALLEAIDQPNVKVQMDLYHCQIMEGDVLQPLLQYLPTDKVAHIQIANTPDRHEPKISNIQNGEINYATVFDLIDNLGYAGWIGCEYKPKLQSQPTGESSATSMGLDWFKPYR